MHIRLPQLKIGIVKGAVGNRTHFRADGRSGSEAYRLRRSKSVTTEAPVENRTHVRTDGRGVSEA